MALVGKTQRYPIPHEPGEWIETKHLTYGQMEEARQAHLARTVTASKDFPSEMLDKAQADARADTSKTGIPAQYDFGVMIKHAITAWSYKEGGQAVPVTEENVALLDAATVAWLGDLVRSENVRDTASGEGSKTS